MSAEHVGTNHVVYDDHVFVSLTIRHLDTDSYSRSVDRCAIKAIRTEAKRFSPVRTIEFVESDYSADREPDDGKGNGRPYCLSSCRFRLRR